MARISEKNLKNPRATNGTHVPLTKNNNNNKIKNK